jgi:hypothetical protein
VEALRDTAPEHEKNEYPEDRLAKVRDEAALAQTEIENQFPLLHAQVAIAQWGALESLIRTFLASWLLNNPSARTVQGLRRVRVRVAEYEDLAAEERYFHVIDLLEDELQTRRQPGIARFESLLEVFGLTSPVSDAVKKDLFELYHVRNVLVHRRGLADRRVVQACPWLSLSAGQPVVVTHASAHRYEQRRATTCLSSFRGFA